MFLEGINLAARPEPLKNIDEKFQRSADKLNANQQRFAFERNWDLQSQQFFSVLVVEFFQDFVGVTDFAPFSEQTLIGH